MRKRGIPSCWAEYTSFRGRGYWVKSLCASLLCISVLSGCDDSNLSKTKEQKQTDGPAEQTVSSKEIAKDDHLSVINRTGHISLKPKSRLYQLSKQLDKTAVSRSSFLHDKTAAEAQLAALKYEKYPAFKPSAGVTIGNNSQSTAQLSVEQLVWDGGRLRARLSGAELNVVKKQLQSWMDRNQAIFEGLSLYTEILRFEARLKTYQNLKADYDTLSQQLNLRFEGGVSDRGELLRMNASSQDLELKIILDQSKQRQASADLQELILSDAKVAADITLHQAQQQCRRNWKSSEAPIDAVSKIDFEMAAIELELVKSKRYPKLMANVATDYSNNSWSKPSVGLYLDASEMLGMGRKHTLMSAEASLRSAQAKYQLQKNDTDKELKRYASQFSEYQNDISHLKKIEAENLKTIKLYKEQLASGSIEVAAGIDLYRAKADTQIAIINAQANSVVNCMTISMLRGQLAPLRFEK